MKTKRTTRSSGRVNSVQTHLQTNLVRLNKFIAESGVSSRRKADTLIEEGQIQINGKRVFELGQKIDPTKDKVMMDGKRLIQVSKKIYLMVNKPSGVLSSMSDPKGRPTVADLVSSGVSAGPNAVPYRVFPVGRLDWETEGLLLMTNDGSFSYKITHPKEEISKSYLVKVNGRPTESQLQKLLNGVTIIGGRVKAKSVEKIKGKSSKYDWIKIVITQGKYRQIRRMFEKIGFDVLKLQRIAIGGLKIGTLKRGEYVFLTGSALERIFQQNQELSPKRKSHHHSRGVRRKTSR